MNEFNISYWFFAYRYVAEVFGYVYKHRKLIKGYKITWAPTVLRHFSARLEPMPPLDKNEESEEKDEVLQNLQGAILNRNQGLVRRKSYPIYKSIYCLWIIASRGIANDWLLDYIGVSWNQNIHCL